MLTLKQQEDLVNNGLAKRSISGNFVTYKYTPKVFYNNLWDKHDISECRGHTYDITTGELVLAAPQKTFNYSENGTWGDMSLDTPVRLFKKINGFMATARLYKGSLIIGTTGTTSSDYAKLAREYIKKEWVGEDITSVFEICSPCDPHIVSEVHGAHLLGFRMQMFEADEWVFVPSPYTHVTSTTLQGALDKVKTCKGEGYMMYTADYKSVCKLKSPYYIGKKLLMRINSDRWNSVASYGSDAIKGKLDGRWHAVVDYLLEHYGACWGGFNEQRRRAIIEGVESLGGW